MQTTLHQSANIVDILRPSLVYPLILLHIVPHPMPKTLNQGISEHHPHHLGQQTRLTLLLLYAIFEIHHLYPRYRYFHGVVLSQQKFLEIVQILPPVFLRIDIDVDILLGGEGEIEIEGEYEVGVGVGFAENEVVEMGVAVPHVVVVEETPVYTMLAEDSFDAAHLPTQFL